MQKQLQSANSLIGAVGPGRSRIIQVAAKFIAFVWGRGESESFAIAAAEILLVQLRDENRVTEAM